ncbi:hypothetical protein V8G54_030206 [Vigna mungo]|uniref:Uncharacterized protein n=1 Tax=Vigna mungo TaxID=3915 RepID=A0AAQ3MWD4_VIGMU
MPKPNILIFLCDFNLFTVPTSWLLQLLYYNAVVLLILWHILLFLLAEKGANIVDANLRILWERIEQVRKRESLIKRVEWNYKHGYDDKYKKDCMITESAEVIGLACGAIGLVFLLGSLIIFLLSLLIYAYHVSN